MPLKIPTRCRYPGCPARVRGVRFCPTHHGTDSRLQDARRGTSAERGYDATWARLADLRRHLDACLCQVCLQHERLTVARIVDHIVPIHVRPDWRLELDNTQVICAACHQQKTTADTIRYGSSTTTALTPPQRQNRTLAQRPLGCPRID